MSVQARQPKGIPVGGQFAASVRDEADVNLTAEADGFTKTYGAFTHADKQWATVRTTNGGEVSGYIATQGATYPMDVTQADGHVTGLSGWRIKDVRLEDAPEPKAPDAVDEWADHLSSVGLHIGEWAELGDTRIRIVEDAPEASLDIDNPATWDYDPPAVATYADLSELVDGYHPVDHFRLPGLVDQEFRLEKNFDLAAVAMAREPHDYAIDGWEDEEGYDPEDTVAMYEELRNAFTSNPWNVAPLIAIQHEDGDLELLDGNHRAALALDAGRTQHPAYVVRADNLPEPAVTQPLRTDIQVRADNPAAGDPVPGEPGWHYPRTTTKGRIPVPAGAAATRQGRGRFASVMARQFTNLQGDLAAAWKDAGNLLDEATPQIR